VPFTTGEFVVALILATALAMIVFSHADRNGNQRATAWGVATFFFGIFAVAVYFARHWSRRR
jgi:Na+/H+ antiporter NhaD/arsenite permease-like protein